MRKLSGFVFIILFAVLCIADETCASYTEGYLEYTVSENSVTITGYFGREEEVTIPAMIAGNPVNIIGTGAFINTTVKTLYLPDTIMEIQGNAVGIGVTVVYNSNTDEPVTGGGVSDDLNGHETTGKEGIEDNNSISSNVSKGTADGSAENNSGTMENVGGGKEEAEIDIESGNMISSDVPDSASDYESVGDSTTMVVDADRETGSITNTVKGYYVIPIGLIVLTAVISIGVIYRRARKIS